MSLSHWVLSLICPHCARVMADDRLERAEMDQVRIIHSRTMEREKMEVRTADIRMATNALISAREETERARQEMSGDAV